MEQRKVKPRRPRDVAAPFCRKFFAGEFLTGAPTHRAVELHPCTALWQSQICDVVWCVYLYMCLYMCLYVYCMSTCVSTCICACISTCVSTCICACISTCMCNYTYIALLLVYVYIYLYTTCTYRIITRIAYLLVVFLYFVLLDYMSTCISVGMYCICYMSTCIFTVCIT